MFSHFVSWVAPLRTLPIAVSPAHAVLACSITNTFLRLSYLDISIYDVFSRMWLQMKEQKKNRPWPVLVEVPDFVSSRFLTSLEHPFFPSFASFLFWDFISFTCKLRFFFFFLIISVFACLSFPWFVFMLSFLTLLSTGCWLFPFDIHCERIQTDWYVY